MEAITYGEFFAVAKKVDAKKALLPKEKHIVIQSKSSNFIKVEAKEEKVAINTAVEVKSPVIEPIKEEIKVSTNNFQEVKESFDITVYNYKHIEKPLTGARKIRVNQKVALKTKEFFNKLASEDFVDQEKIEVREPEIVDRVELDDELRNNDFSKEAIPSVDDYLQKEVPTHYENTSNSGLINKLSGDVAILKVETQKRSEELSELEARYNELVDQKRIEELEEEKLSYTATLDGLASKIKNLEEAIAAMSATKSR